MIRLSQALVDDRMASHFEPPVGLGLSERERQRREALEDNRRLAEENARLLEENYALREAAAMWIRLYERQLERANQAASTRSRTRATALAR
jgi:hypothetical protein